MKNNLSSILKQHQQAIHDAWFEKMLGSYPKASRKYFARVDNVFTNPVGANLARSLSNLLNELLKEEPDADEVQAQLNMILRIKAVQETLPSQAVSFVPALKQIIERVCEGELRTGEIDMAALMDFYSDLDTVTLLAFDVYSESRDLIYELQLRQIRETNDILVKAELLDRSMDMDAFMQCTSSLEQGGSCSGECQE